MKNSFSVLAWHSDIKYSGSGQVVVCGENKMREYGLGKQKAGPPLHMKMGFGVVALISLQTHFP